MRLAVELYGTVVGELIGQPSLQQDIKTFVQNLRNGVPVGRPGSSEVAE